MKVAFAAPVIAANAVRMSSQTHTLSICWIYVLSSVLLRRCLAGLPGKKKGKALNTDGFRCSRWLFVSPSNPLTLFLSSPSFFFFFFLFVSRCCGFRCSRCCGFRCSRLPFVSTSSCLTFFLRSPPPFLFFFAFLSLDVCCAPPPPTSFFPPQDDKASITDQLPGGRLPSPELLPRMDVLNRFGQIFR